MESSRQLLLVILAVVLVDLCFARTDSCPPNERDTPGDRCQVTCNGCRDCSPCECKPGYIRSAPGEDCMTEQDCHSLHLKWLHEAKHQNKKDKFFNCP